MRSTECRNAVVVMVLALCLPAVALAGGLTLRADELAEWRIVVSPDAVDAEVYAAEELQRLFEDRTSIRVPITSSAMPSRRSFCVGSGKALRRSPVAIDAADLGEEELCIRVGKREIAIAGGSPRATLYGVYEFLERYMGVRFLTADHTHVPKSDALAIPRGDYRYAPPFLFRWSFYKETLDAPAFAARLRNNCAVHGPRLGGATDQPLVQHSLCRQVPVERYGARHPEYFALVDGERLLDVPGGAQVCPMTPDIIDIVVDAVLAEIRKKPSTKVVSVSQNDNRFYCTCERCAALNEREGTPMAAHLSLVNAVADRVAVEYPDVRIGTLAYWYTRKPPRGIRPRPNVQIWLCSFEHCPMHAIDDPACPPNVDFLRDLDAWRALTDDLWVWHYVANLRQMDLPLPNFESIGPTIRAFRDRGVRGLFMQGNGRCPAGEMSDLRNYVVSRLLWNPDLDCQSLVREFLDLHYGPAAGPIREYLKVVHDAAERHGAHPTIFAGPWELGLGPDEAELMMALFDESRRGSSFAEKACLPAYKTLIEAGGTLTYDNGMLRMAYPPDHAERVAQYAGLCRKHGFDRHGEFMSLSPYLEQVQSQVHGASAIRVESDTWRVTLSQAVNGVVVDMLHKPTGHSLLRAMGSPGIGIPYGALREAGIEGLGDYGEFDVEMSGNEVRLRKVTDEYGSSLVRTLRLEGQVVVCETSFWYKGVEPAEFRFLVTPELNTGGVSRKGALTGHVWAGEWRSLGLCPAREQVGEPVPLDQARGLVGFHNAEAGVGVVVGYDEGQFEAPYIEWDLGLTQVDVGLFTKRVTLRTGGAFRFRYWFECTDAPLSPLK